MATSTPLSERDARFERVRARMRDEGLDALLIGWKRALVDWTRLRPLPRPTSIYGATMR